MSFEELPNPPVPDFFKAREVANSTLSRREATVRTPPTIAHVLRKMALAYIYIGNRAGRTYDVIKCAKDCLVSECTTRMGEIS